MSSKLEEWWLAYSCQGLTSYEERWLEGSSEDVVLASIPDYIQLNCPKVTIKSAAQWTGYLRGEREEIPEQFSKFTSQIQNN